jgi:hypothetical protein
MNNTFEVPRNIISNVLYRQTGIKIPASNIDLVTAENICNSIVAYDDGNIDREKFNRIIIFNVNQILDREGKPLFYRARKDEAQFTKFRVNFFYN